ncbi:putative HTH-type transcriptional regulator YurK [Andreprevotia sp. IGB-42]|uniref:GntR family transcriptional regulator n=1 Tax=Andreprevotia sp. IGB-42 TaxID=2497473 RepID=UPI001358E538|nr:GntR family transcriptional regulator [Andreprevotia sp. IGB-42]KAF0813848.1 putative HTH-type transcriptional regulator YurK [Andreprevotia sp. IGB-42]
MLNVPQFPHGHVSLYSRIRDELRHGIVSGRYLPHDRMPSESQLMQQYSVSRITVRQALGDLEKEQLIFKVPGKGSYVSRPKPFQELGRLQGFAEAMATQGHETYNHVVSIATLAASDVVATRLQLAPAEPVCELRRVRYLNREPVSLDVTYVHSRIGTLLAREDLASRDIFLILENDYGIALGHADLAIDAVLADAATAALLQVDTGAPILRIERLTHTHDGQPLDFEYLYCRADNFQYRLRIARG